MLLNEFFELVERDPIVAPELIGRTVKPRFLGPCKVCGERRFFCDCDEQQPTRGMEVLAQQGTGEGQQPSSGE